MKFGFTCEQPSDFNMTNYIIKVDKALLNSYVLNKLQFNLNINTNQSTINSCLNKNIGLLKVYSKFSLTKKALKCNIVLYLEYLWN